MPAYTTALKYQPQWKTVYVDAFAGTGRRVDSQQQTGTGTLIPELAAPDAQAFLKGSVQIALETEPTFDRYLFIEKNSKRVDELAKLKVQFPDKSNAIDVVKSEANQYLQEWCISTDWRRWRAVVFLDPYGMQVNWATIEALARTEAVDLWLLFPLGQAVNRLLTKKEPPPPEWADKLDRFLGTGEWRSFYRSGGQLTLDGAQVGEIKNVTLNEIAQFFVERLQTVFAGVAPNPLYLHNSTNTPLYLLCFAAANPKGARLALKIAQDVLRK